MVLVLVYWVGVWFLFLMGFPVMDRGPDDPGSPTAGP